VSPQISSPKVKEMTSLHNHRLLNKIAQANILKLRISLESSADYCIVHHGTYVCSFHCPRSQCNDIGLTHVHSYPLDGFHQEI
jgi:hypothetical protein